MKHTSRIVIPYHRIVDTQRIIDTVLSKDNYTKHPYQISTTNERLQKLMYSILLTEAKSLPLTITCQRGITECFVINISLK